MQYVAVVWLMSVTDIAVDADAVADRLLDVDDAGDVDGYLRLMGERKTDRCLLNEWFATDEQD